MLAMEPAEPIDNTEPADPMDRIDPTDPIDRIDPTEPIDRIEPVEPCRPAPDRRAALASCRDSGTGRGSAMGPMVPQRPPGHEPRGQPAGRAATVCNHRPMRAVATRVTRADVRVDGEVVGEIDRPGVLALVGVTHSDTAETARALAAKLHELRILRDEQSCATASAPLLVVSQFTLYGRTDKGRRPSWSDAAPGPVAAPLVEELVAELRRRGATVATGLFGAMMQVSSVNDGPFTVLVEVV